jgi:hypothetical protein
MFLKLCPEITSLIAHVIIIIIIICKRILFFALNLITLRFQYLYLTILTV